LKVVEAFLEVVDGGREAARQSGCEGWRLNTALPYPKHTTLARSPGRDKEEKSTEDSRN
jgi:hypothetical protein